MERSPLNVGVLLGDPRLPYSFSHEGRLGEEELTAFAQLKTALGQLNDYTFSYFDDHERLIDELRRARLDLVINFCDTGYRNNWEQVIHIPALLEILDIPYTGNHGMALHMSSDKALMHDVAVSLSVPVVNELYVDLRTSPLPEPKKYPALIKPNVGAGSYGMNKDCVVHNADQAEKYMNWLAEFINPPQIIIQDFITGPEYTLGLIGTPESGLTPLKAAQIDYTRLDPELPPVFTYDAKFNAASPYWQQLSHREAELDDNTHAKLVEYCTRFYRRLGLRDFVRFDFRADAEGKIFLLDINPNPTWYADSRMAMMAEWSGYSYADMLRLILASAAARYGL